MSGPNLVETKEYFRTDICGILLTSLSPYFPMFGWQNNINYHSKYQQEAYVTHNVPYLTSGILLKETATWGICHIDHIEFIVINILYCLSN